MTYEEIASHERLAMMERKGGSLDVYGKLRLLLPKNDPYFTLNDYYTQF